MNPELVWWALAGYIVLALFVAWGSRKGTQTSNLSGYFLGGRKMNGVLSALSYSATTYSAFMMVGLAGLTYQGGVGAFGFEMIYFMGVSLVSIFGPRFWLAGKRFGYVTPAEMIGDRYNSRAVAMAVALTSCLFLIPYSAVQLIGVGYLLQGITDGAIPFTVGVVIATVLAVVFSYVAGIRSVMWTDALQALVMIVTATIVVLLLVRGLGGFDSFFTTLKTEHADMLTVPGNGYFNIFTFLGLTIPWFFFSLSNPQVSQRLFMPKSLKSLRHMLLIFLVFGFIYTMVSVMWGFSALIMFPDLASADLATPKLLSSDLVPPVLGVIVMVGILAAAISTIDSILLTLSSMFARDVYGNASKRTNDRRQLLAGKIIIPVIAVLAFAFAQLELDLIAILSVAASAGLIVTVPATIGTFFWKKGTQAGVLISVIAGAVLVIYLEVTGRTPLHLASGIWGLLISSILFVGVSLVTSAPDEKAEWFVDHLKGELRQRQRKSSTDKNVS
ncbi:sodium:solute symporter family protein [Tuberibacillus sp. Marseille-P3662]|uniref:sodium:solute symporter family protein n=1 Tax=Tuberibacillus sp. Marseille-P3662 TaxID=1965358 RepID=UPI000A1CAD28|nr:sodium:solute symporter family protein [Tuberibacillus sp. Marseille-P3662]